MTKPPSKQRSGYVAGNARTSAADVSHLRVSQPAPRKKPAAPQTAGDVTKGDRIAKVLARAGVASRRDAERMIAEGLVAVNGKTIDSPALNVLPTDRITVNGAPLAAAEPARLWLYHKPEGLVTTARDEKGRTTVFDTLPEDMPRVMSVGRLDISSEGLLLLTNDGEMKRRLELPETGWLRKYRVRVNGRPDAALLEPLRRGLVIEGERFQTMEVEIDRQQGANAWLTVGIREGRNREVRRAMEAVGLVVNRLIRISYGPFRLGDLAPGAVEEVRPRVLRDQLGLAETPGTQPDAATGQPTRNPRVMRDGAARGKGPVARRSGPEGTPHQVGLPHPAGPPRKDRAEKGKKNSARHAAPAATQDPAARVARGRHAGKAAGQQDPGTGGKTGGKTGFAKQARTTARSATKTETGQADGSSGKSAKTSAPKVVTTAKSSMKPKQRTERAKTAGRPPKPRGSG